MKETEIEKHTKSPRATGCFVIMLHQRNSKKASQTTDLQGTACLGQLQKFVPLPVCSVPYQEE